MQPINSLGDPQPDSATGLCKASCPYKKEWRHPYWHNTAWCWHLMKDLGWHDYWMADCLQENPDKQLVKYQQNGRTAPPNVKLTGWPFPGKQAKPQKLI
jgi:hypothetical protein